MFLPLSILTLGSLPKADVASGSGFFSLTRQLGGSIGIAAITTLVAKQQFVHRSQLVYISPSSTRLTPSGSAPAPPTSIRSPAIPSACTTMALAQIDRAVDFQASRCSVTATSFTPSPSFSAIVLPLILLLGKTAKPRTQGKLIYEHSRHRR